MEPKKPEDLVGVGGWESVWKGRDIPAPVDPTQKGAPFHRDRVFHKYFSGIFAAHGGKNLLEVGCAKSQWLPYFHLRHGLEVEGLDYSPTGCSQAKEILEKADVPGEIHCGDLFSGDSGLGGKFDYVLSFGLVEHFPDTDSVTKALGTMLKPGGVLITFVPNTAWLPGLLLRLINREVYDQHIALTPQRLSSAAEQSGLTPLESRYLMTFSPSTLAMALAVRKQNFWVKGIWNSFDLTTNVTSWLIESGVPDCPNRVTSPYVVCSAQK